MVLNGLIVIYPMVIFLYVVITLVAAYYAKATLKQSFRKWLLISALLPFISIFVLLIYTALQKKKAD
jgi:putative effector of murein hydrolase